VQTLFPTDSPLIPIQGSTEGFPVRRIYCVARNYAEHAREMGATGREAPFFFCKPGDAALPVAVGAIGRLPYPPRTTDLHHEVELVVAMGATARAVAASAASQCILGYAVGLDMTRRDIQVELKKLGRPWELAKAFDFSAPIGAIRRKNEVGAMSKGTMRLTVNGTERQRGDLADMIWSAAEIVAILSEYFELKAGDLVFTGTPAGVGPVVAGDRLVAGIAGLADLSVDIVARE
jgi:fumarylpyruvate hydrolase